MTGGSTMGLTMVQTVSNYTKFLHYFVGSITSAGQVRLVH